MDTMESTNDTRHPRSRRLSGSNGGGQSAEKIEVAAAEDLAGLTIGVQQGTTGDLAPI